MKWKSQIIPILILLEYCIPQVLFFLIKTTPLEDEGIYYNEKYFIHHNNTGISNTPNSGSK